MKKLEYHAFFYDGESPVRKSARVRITSEGLSVKYNNSPDIIWLYGDIRQNEEVYSDTETHLVNSKFPNQLLVIEEADFLSVLRTFFPSIELRESQRLVSIRRLSVLGTVLLLIMMPVFYFILIPSFSDRLSLKSYRRIFPFLLKKNCPLPTCR